MCDLMNTGLYAEKVRLRDRVEQLERALRDRREEAKATTDPCPTLYHVCMASDGTVCIQIEDGPIIAVGERDIDLLGRICDIARREVNRRRTEGTLYPRLPV